MAESSFISYAALLSELARRLAPTLPSGNVRPPAALMAILNLTPDSFSHAGADLSPQAAISAAWQAVQPAPSATPDAALRSPALPPRPMAQLLDIGAESTRPGSHPVASSQQIARILPVLNALIQARYPIPITIDTTSAAVADATLSAGAAAINDTSAGLADPDILSVTARHHAGYIAMHMQGTPATMQDNPRYTDVVAEVTDFLARRLDAARSAGIPSELLVADPGIGFGKTTGHNLALLRSLAQIKRDLGVPLLVGTSRKGFLGKITGRPNPKDRLFATAASVAWAAASGADIHRVHDIAEMADVLKVIDALTSATH